MACVSGLSYELVNLNKFELRTRWVFLYVLLLISYTGRGGMSFLPTLVGDSELRT
jgi:hypothetical protein